MKFLPILGLGCLLATSSAAAAEPVDTELPKYDVSWTSPSASIVDSMPIGNGQTAALVWAESNKDLIVSVATGDSWDENARSIRLGNVRIALTPNPFARGLPFAQVLKYKTGEVTFSVGSPAVQIRVWVDANHPVVHVEASSDTAFGIQVTPELWRTTTQDISSNTPWKDFIHVAKDVSSNSSTLKVVLKPDVTFATATGVGWYHRNETSHWGETMENQSFDVAKYGIKDPLTNRTMGALLRGTGLAPSGNKLASSADQRQFRVDIATHTELTPQAATWQAALEAKSNEVFGADLETLRSAHQKYWSELWNRSYIFASGDTDAENATKGWIAARGGAFHSLQVPLPRLPERRARRRSLHRAGRHRQNCAASHAVAPGQRPDAQRLECLAQHLECALQAVGAEEDLGRWASDGQHAQQLDGRASNARGRRAGQRCGTGRRHGDGQRRSWRFRGRRRCRHTDGSAGRGRLGERGRQQLGRRADQRRRHPEWRRFGERGRRRREPWWRSGSDNAWCRHVNQCCWRVGCVFAGRLQLPRGWRTGDLAGLGRARARAGRRVAAQSPKRAVSRYHPRVPSRDTRNVGVSSGGERFQPGRFFNVDS